MMRKCIKMYKRWKLKIKIVVKEQFIEVNSMVLAKTVENVNEFLKYSKYNAENKE